MQLEYRKASQKAKDCVEKVRIMMREHVRLTKELHKAEEKTSADSRPVGLSTNQYDLCSCLKIVSACMYFVFGRFECCFLVSVCKQASPNVLMEPHCKIN